MFGLEAGRNGEWGKGRSVGWDWDWDWDWAGRSVGVHDVRHMRWSGMHGLPCLDPWSTQLIFSSARGMIIDRDFVERGGAMARVKVSDRFQIVIPREVRDALHIRKGQTVSVIPVGGVIEVVPDQELATLEGAFPGIALTNVRDESDRDERQSA